MEKVKEEMKGIIEKYEVEEIFGTPLPEIGGRKVVYEQEVLNAIKLRDIEIIKALHDAGFRKEEIDEDDIDEYACHCVEKGYTTRDSILGYMRLRVK